MTPFERAVEITLGYEGEESDHPQDPGGYTRYGIAQRWHPDVKVRELSRADAIALLETRYWFPIRGELLPWPLAAAIFDHAVHSGPGTAARALQRAVGVEADGAIGPITRAALAELPQRAILAECFRRRVRELALEGRPVFMAGWLARVADLGLVCGFELGQAVRARAA